MNKPKKRIVLATGGTGGHVFPAQALANELAEQHYEVFIFTDGRGQAFSDSSLPVVKIPSSQVKGNQIERVGGYLKILFGLVLAFFQLLRLRPKVVVGFGGYASFPTMLAAAILRIPTIGHQADAFFGRTNRFLARWMTRIATSFPHVENIPPAYRDKVIFTGLPVRADIKPAPYVSSEKLNPFYLLVTGGSQGARVFSEIIPQAVHLLDPTLQKRLYITQQCRPESIEITKALYERTKARVQLFPFIEKMGEQYKKAHLIISRAGASSVTETSIVGRPALFVPYPYAMDDHQFYNAKQAVNVKGGWLMREKDFSSKVLAKYLSDVMTSSWKLNEAAVNMQSLASGDAALRLAHLVKLIAVQER